LYAVLYNRVRNRSIAASSVVAYAAIAAIADIVIQLIIIDVDGVHCPRNTRIDNFHPDNVFKGGAKINDVIIGVRVEVAFPFRTINNKRVGLFNTVIFHIINILNRHSRFTAL
jgi:hypothetical protein